MEPDFLDLLTFRAGPFEAEVGWDSGTAGAGAASAGRETAAAGAAGGTA